jgi:hypothetical protein
MTIEFIRLPKRPKGKGHGLGGSLKVRELDDHDREVIERAKAAMERPEPARGRVEKRGGWD